jgi:hypothetical protein
MSQIFQALNRSRLQQISLPFSLLPYRENRRSAQRFGPRGLQPAGREFESLSAHGLGFFWHRVHYNACSADQFPRPT